MYFNLTTKESTLLNWVGKEKDNESNLGDHGVRKYEYETGRFLSIDPLWAKYIGWTPYQYTRNNPITRVDITGGADFILNGGGKLSDGKNDGLLYATTNFAFDASITKNSKGNIVGFNFNKMAGNSYQLPNSGSKELKMMLTKHYSAQVGEGGSVGGVNTFFWGGRNFNPPNSKRSGEATDEIKNAITNAIKAGKSESISYHVHDHPRGDDDTRPSEGDRTSLYGFNNKYGIDLQFGILFTGSQLNNNQSATIYNGYDTEGDVTFPRKTLEDFTK